MCPTTTTGSFEIKPADPTKSSRDESSHAVLQCFSKRSGHSSLSARRARTQFDSDPVHFEASTVHTTFYIVNDLLRQSMTSWCFGSLTMYLLKFLYALRLESLLLKSNRLLTSLEVLPTRLCRTLRLGESLMYLLQLYLVENVFWQSAILR
jgi:hypothetical protein